MAVGVGTQGGFINLLAPDQRSRHGSIPCTATTLTDSKMVVYIVVVNGEINSVFFDSQLAAHHAKEMQRAWSIVKVVKKEVNEF